MQEHILCGLVLMGILICMRERKMEIVASDTLPRLNYYTNAFATEVPHWKLNYRQLDLIKPNSSRKGMERKRKVENPWPLQICPNL